jgi:DNA-binding HxlR family transcriptional regulator
MDWKDVDTTYCGIAAATSTVGDRWSQLILREVFFGVRRYSDIQDHIDVSSSILADRLQKLIENGVLSKVRYRTDGNRHRYEYQLTERGLGLAYVQLALAEFGYEHLLNEDQRLVSLHDRGTGQRVRLGLIREDGTPVDRDAVEARINEHLGHDTR